MKDFCPNCGEYYSDIDWEVQICHLCNHDANPKGNQDRDSYNTLQDDQGKKKIYLKKD